MTGLAPPAYVLQARFDPTSHEVGGHLRLRYTNRSQAPLALVWLQLYPNTFRPQSVYLRTAGERFNLDTLYPAGRDPGWLEVRQTRVDGVSTEPLVHDAFLRVPLPRPLAPGEATTLELDFTTHIPQVYDALGRVGEDYTLGYWYPRVAILRPEGWDLTPRTMPLQGTQDEFSSFDVHLVLPRRYGVGATGQREPNELAASPKERALHFTASQVRSFGLTLSPELRETSATRAGLTVHVLAREDEQALVPQILTEAFDQVEFYSQLVGPYPYRDLTIASSEALPVGGVALPQLVLTSRLLTRLETLGQGWYEAGYTALGAYGIARQWCFGVLGSDGAHDAWLDYSFSSYLAMRYLERPGGPEQGRSTRVLAGPGWLARLASARSARQTQLGVARAQDQAGLAVPLTTRLTELPLGQVGPTYYARGPVVIEMLRQELGEAAFARFLHALYADLHFRNAATADVQRVAEQAAGRSLERFFATWVRGAGARLDHRLAGWKQRVMPDGHRHVEARVVQQGTTDLPVTLGFKLADGRELEAQYRPGHPLVELEADSRVVAVVIDPEGRVLEAHPGSGEGRRQGVLPALPEGLPLPGELAAGLPAGRGGRGGGTNASPLGPGLGVPARSRDLDLTSIQSAHQGLSVGYQAHQVVWGVGYGQAINGIGNYDSSVAVGLAHRPEGTLGGAELGLAWQPRVGENPTAGLDLGLERRAYADDGRGSPAFAVYVARINTVLVTRKVLFGERPAGGRYLLGLELAPTLFEQTGAFLSPSLDLSQHLDLAWNTTLSGRVFAVTTLGARNVRDGVRLDREGQFRTYGLPTSTSLLAANLELAGPLGATFYAPVVPVPLMFRGLAFVNAGFAGTYTWEAGAGLRCGLAGLGSTTVGLDWAPYSSAYGFQPGTVQLKGGYGF